MGRSARRLNRQCATVMILHPDDLLAVAGGWLARYWPLPRVVLAIGAGGAAALQATPQIDLRSRRTRRRSRSTAATQSLARLQSATPNIDRVARRWLPRREILAARLARTGRSITIGQYALTMIGVAALATVALIGVDLDRAGAGGVGRPVPRYGACHIWW